jgi:ferredoxin
MPAQGSSQRRRRREFDVVQVTFITAEGERVIAQGVEGTRLLELGQGAGLPLEGTCEGQMACSTCHVIVSPDWFAQLKPASSDEEDMLDLAAGVSRTSRLSCQITLTDKLDGLEVRIPGHANDMQLR